MTEKPKRGRWAPGQSGNPRGKPKGVGEVAKLRADIAKSVPNIIAMLTTAAEAGDVQAARLLLERVLPPVKAIELGQPINIPETGSFTDKGRAVLSAIAAGELSAGQGSQLLSAIAGVARVAEIDELEARIRVLEAQNGQS